MPLVKNNPYPDVPDYFGQYLKWKKVVLPSGEVLYEIPGHPERVFDPTLSNATGKVTLRANPSLQIAADQKQQNAQDKAQKQAEQARSPQGQITNTALGVGGTVAAGVGLHYALKGDNTTAAATPTTLVNPKTGAPAVLPTTQGQAAAQGATAPTGAAFNGSAPTDTGSLGQPTGDFSSNPSASVTEIGPTTMPDGSPGHAMSDGAKVGDNGSAITPEGQAIPAGQAPWRSGLQIAGGAAQAYTGYKQYQAGQKLGGAANALGGAYNIYAGSSALANGGVASGAASYARPVGNAVAAAQIGQNMISQKGDSRDRAAASKTEAMKAALNYIPGYGTAAYLALAAGDAATGGKLTSTWTSANKSLDRFNNKFDFGLQRAVDAKLFHQSTKGVQMEHSGQLAERAPDDQQYQDYLGAARWGGKYGVEKGANPFFNGKYASWDDYKRGGLDATDLSGVYGNINVYGPDWAHLTDEQRRAVTQANIESNLYNSKKGEVYITDRDKAKENFANVMKGFQAGVQTTTQATGVAPIQPGQTPMTTVNAAKIQPLQPGFTPQATAGFATGGVQPAQPALAQAAAQGVTMPPLVPYIRQTTLSPGIGLDGRRIVYQ